MLTSPYYDQMLVALQIFQVFKLYQSHPLFDLINIFNEIEGDVNDAMYLPTAVELVHELSILIEFVFSKNDHILSFESQHFESMMSSSGLVI